MSNPNMPEIPPAGKKAVFTIGGSTAALLGSFIPGIGTVIGAGLGGIIGGIGVIASEAKRRQDK